MKKIISLLTITLLATLVSFSQGPAPLRFNYQGVARNSVGNVLANQTIALRLTIHDGAPAGPNVFQQTFTAVTNPFGLFNVQVGTPALSSVSWGVGDKYLQVEIDPAGGSSFINIGTAQIVSVPYSLYSSLANDLVLPFLKTQANAGTLFRINNSGTGISGAIMGTTLSNAANAWGVHGRVDNTSAGGFSAGVLGTNLSTTGNGIGVFGSQNGSGWGVYGTTPSGIGVHGVTTSGFGVRGESNTGIAVLGVSNAGQAGRFENFSNTNPVPTVGILNSGGTGSALDVTTSGTGRAGFFQLNNAASNSNAVVINTNTVNAPALSVTGPNIWGSAIGITNLTSGMEWRMNVSGTTFGITKIPGTTFTPIQLFSDGQVEFANTAGLNRMRILDNGNVGVGTTTPANKLTVVAGSNDGIAINTTGTNFANAVISFNNTTTAPAQVNNANISLKSGVGDRALQFFNFSAGLLPTDRIYNFLDNTTASVITVLNNGNVGIGIPAPTTRFHVAGTVRIVDGTQANNFILRSDAVGNANWVDPAVIIPGAFLWTRVGTNLWNTNLGDNVGIGTTTPTHRFDVTHSGSTGIGINSSVGFSVLDINAASGDAAIRLANAGVNQWNIRNQPGTDNLQIFELGGGGERMHIQNTTGNVSIGGITPTYRLDVQHGGSTGAHIVSTASFSVVDIDAASGDAALRFQRAGVNQWNTRNRPADDYYEIFELGGGGSRFVIQDGTGNVGIGQTAAPSYKLDVLHAGSTGARIQSSASFSVVDIDAASGDAALRFVKAGVNQWNTRNRPADDYYEIFELGGGGSRFVIQDGTGNVGIGQTAAPSYKLDVLHAGSTGARIQSSASFSVVDIDAASGDAALRFVKAGVNQWNTRNRPADDYYEIFELGGGGSRFVIQDGTGNVGIGQTAAPSYKLDVLHGGSTGLRVQSSASFSVVDIDANSGDAALRFVKAGVNQWNTRNNPGTDDYQIFELGGGGERMRIENTTGNVNITANLNVGGTLSKGAGAFKIDHPLDPANKYLWHSFVESPDMMNIYNGNIVTDASGKATVQLPDYFEALNMEFRYQLTVIGAFAQAIINKEVSNNKFEIATNQPNVKVSWQVTGVRHDPYAQANRIPNSIDKEAANKGMYLHPELYNQPKTKIIGYTPEPIESSLNDAKVSPAKVAPATTGGSLDQQAIVPPANKPVDNSGSVAPQTEVKKAEVKPVEVKGTSVENVPNKPVEEKKKISNVPESTKTD